MPLSGSDGAVRRSPGAAPSCRPRARLPTAAAAAILGSLAFAGVAHAAGQPHTGAASTSAPAAQLPLWYQTALKATAFGGESPVPTDPESVTGKVRRTHADYRSGTGSPAVDAGQAVGQTLIAGETLQMSGRTLFRLNSHLPVTAAQREVTQLKSALAYVTGVTCEGYTDYGPHSIVKDIALGKRRAVKVCDLISAEHPKIATRTISYGSARPAVIGGTTHAQRSRNRRVVVDITRSTVSAPQAPDLAPALAGDGAITVHITPQPSAVPIVGYQYSLDGGKTWVDLATTGSNPAVGTITGLTNGTTYDIIVRDLDAAGISLHSQHQSGTPTAPAPTPPPPTPPPPTTTTPPPTSPTPTPPVVVPGPPTLNSATPGDGRATAVFAAPASNAGGSPTGYEVSTDGGATWSAVTTTGSSPYTIVITGLTNGTTYPIDVRAVDSAGDSGPSNTISVTPGAPPNAPTILDGGGNYTGGQYQVQLLWSAGVGGTAATAWQYSQDGGPYVPFPNAVIDNGGTYTSTFSSGITGCPPGGSEPYTIEAINGSGDSAASNTFPVTLCFP